MKLNLGCGHKILPGYINADIAILPGTQVIFDLRQYPYPFKDNSFDEIKAISVLEHLPDTVETIEEIYRVAAEDCLVFLQVPFWNSRFFPIDPTHQKGFHFETFDFFDPSRESYKIRPYYTKAKFKIERIGYVHFLHSTSYGAHWYGKLFQCLLRYISSYLCNIILELKVELRTIKKRLINETG